MASKNPIQHYKHFSSLPVLMHYFEEVTFFLPLTQSNLADTRVNDRYDHINRMYLGVGSPNDYVLGNVVEHIDGMTYSLTGTDASRFAISATGQITLTNNSGLSAGNLSINVVINTLGTLAITIPVVSDATGFHFYADAANGGNDANNGLQPHAPKLTLPTTMSGTFLLKRGSSFTSNSILLSGTLRGYGNPSSANPIINNPSGEAQCVLFNASGTKLYDITLTGAARGNYSFYKDSCEIKRCMADGIGFVDNGSSQGFYVRGGNDFVFRHNTVINTYGDGFYYVTPNRAECAYNYFYTPLGGLADCVQFTNEGSFAKNGQEIWMHHNNLGFLTSSGSLKGLIVVQGCTRACVEYNFGYKGNYFGLGIGGNRITLRYNYMRGCTMTPTVNNEFNGAGDGYQNDCMDWLDNYLNGYHGFLISGYNGPFDKVDIYARGNTCFLTNKSWRATERWSGEVSGNIFACSYNNASIIANGGDAAPAIDLYYNQGLTAPTNGNTVASITGTVTSFTNNGDGTGTFVTGQAHRHWSGESITIAGMAQAALNNTFAVTVVLSATSFKVAIAGSETDVTGASGTYTKVRRYTAITRSGNKYQNQLGTHVRTRPTIAGTCQDGQTVTVSYPSIAGHTVEVEWVLTGRPWAGKTSAACTIDALTSAGPRNPNMPTNPAWNLHLPDLACRLKYIDPNGNESFVMAAWPDGSVYKTIVA